MRKGKKLSREGLRLLETAYYLGFERPGVYLLLSMDYSKQKKFARALEWVEKFIRLGAKFRRQGLGLRAVIYHSKGMALLAKKERVKMVVAFEKSVSDFEASMKDPAPAFQTPGMQSSSLQLQFTAYLLLGRSRQAMSMIRSQAALRKQWYNPFTFSATTTWAQYASMLNAESVAAPSYSWRFDQGEIKVNAPIQLQSTCLVPRDLKQFDVSSGATRLSFSSAGRSLAILQFKSPTAGGKLMLSLQGATSPEGGELAAVVTIRVNDKILLEHKQLFAAGKSSTRTFEITKLLQKTGDNLIRISLDKSSRKQFWLYHVRVHRE